MLESYNKEKIGEVVIFVCLYLNVKGSKIIASQGSDLGCLLG
jgi:hypothetical protein